MNHLNSVLIEGNLVRDPEVGYSPKGTAVCSFSVASNRFYKQGEDFQREVSYFDVTAWSRLAEVCGEYLKKGRGVRVTGRLKQDRWVGTDGKSRSKVFILAEHVEFKPQFKSTSIEEEEREKDTDTDTGREAETPLEEVAPVPEIAAEAG